MPPSIQTDEQGYTDYRETPLVSPTITKAEPSLLPHTESEMIQKRRALVNVLEARRKVKFATIKTILLEDVPRASQMVNEEKDTVWWNDDELGQSLESIRKLMSSMSKRPKSKNATQPHHTLLHRIDATCQHTSEAQIERDQTEDIKLLSAWHHNTYSKRGLEKLVLNSSERNRSIVATIVHASSMVRDNAKINEATKAESIRACSERLTKPARLFARALGKADASCMLVQGPVKRRSRRATELLQ